MICYARWQALRLHLPFHHRFTAVPQPYACLLHLEGVHVLVCGGGAVAARRLPALLQAGARVHVVSPHVHPAIEALHQQGRVCWSRHQVDVQALPEARMLFALTDDPDINARLCAYARERGVWANNASDQSDSTLWVPARVQRGVLSVFVSSAGAAPAAARAARRWLDAHLDPNWGQIAALFAALRPVLSSAEDRARSWRMLGETLPDALTWSPQQWENTLAQWIQQGLLPAFDPHTLVRSSSSSDSE